MAYFCLYHLPLYFITVLLTDILSVLLSSKYHTNIPKSFLLLRCRSTPRRIPRPIHSPLNMSRNTILTSIKLLPNHTFTGERASDLLAHLTDTAVRVELAANGTFG